MTSLDDEFASAPPVGGFSDGVATFFWRGRILGIICIPIQVKSRTKKKIYEVEYCDVIEEAAKTMKRSLLANSPISRWKRTIIVRAKKRVAVFALLAPAVHKKITCDMKRKEARRA